MSSSQAFSKQAFHKTQLQPSILGVRISQQTHECVEWHYNITRHYNEWSMQILIVDKLVYHIPIHIEMTKHKDHPGDCLINVLVVYMLSSTQLRWDTYRIMYVLTWWTVWALTRVNFGVYFPSCEATREINTNITLEWAQKQFITCGHMLFHFLHDKRF